MARRGMLVKICRYVLLPYQELIGATAQNQTIQRMFAVTLFAARYVEFQPTQINGTEACVRFELYGCAYGMFLYS